LTENESGTYNGGVLSQQRLKQLLHYNPETGVFRWSTPLPSSPVKRGAIAGTIDNKGYRRIGIKGVKRGNYYRAHRLAWLYMTGEWPADQIDHIDGNRDNNRWSNLRAADAALNANNKTRAKGYSYIKARRRFVAQVMRNGKNHCLGYFTTADAAAEAYRRGIEWLDGAEGSRE
jgi:hypothetical protein